MTVQETHENTAQSPSTPQLDEPQQTVPAQAGEALTSASPAFVAELSERVQATRATIDSAAAAGDEDLALAHLGELESLVDLAAEHDLALPDTVAYIEQHQTGPIVIDLAAAEAAALAHESC